MNEPHSLLNSLEHHIAQMAPHHKRREAGILLIEAFKEIKALKEQISSMEKSFLLTKTHHD